MYRQRSVSKTELGLSIVISSSPVCFGLPSPRQKIHTGRRWTDVRKTDTPTTTSSGKSPP